MHAPERQNLEDVARAAARRLSRARRVCDRWRSPRAAHVRQPALLAARLPAVEIGCDVGAAAVAELCGLQRTEARGCGWRGYSSTSRVQTLTDESATPSSRLISRSEHPSRRGVPSPAAFSASSLACEHMFAVKSDAIAPRLATARGPRGLAVKTPAFHGSEIASSNLVGPTLAVVLGLELRVVAPARGREDQQRGYQAGRVARRQHDDQARHAAGHRGEEDVGQRQGEDAARYGGAGQPDDRADQPTPVLEEVVVERQSRGSRRGSPPPPPVPRAPSRRAERSRGRILDSPVWAVSSVGRAPALQAGGRPFEPGTAHLCGISDGSKRSALCRLPLSRKAAVTTRNGPPLFVPRSSIVSTRADPVDMPP